MTTSSNNTVNGTRWLGECVDPRGIMAKEGPDTGSYSPPSPVYVPGIESDHEENMGLPDYQSPTPSATRAKFDIRADWIRNTGPRLQTPRSPSSRNPYRAPHLHNRLSPLMRDPYLAPNPHHPDPMARQTMTPISAMGVPLDTTHQYVRTSEFVRQGMKHGIRHNLLGQRFGSLGNQVWCQEKKISSQEEDRKTLIICTETTRTEAQFAIRMTANYLNDHSNVRLSAHLLPC
ncbi:hypothetical protein L1987_00463 [Smallanthus sonchifolius]|uniref:Uncharacterized protein n=1 Tax=Smallanthus sonchifolius TaxID=185202 RepID=A0ACB9K2I5_9ASTR|nr:hypothetical protein L1987_00463 [Smallanthus sonchifolius]